MKKLPRSLMGVKDNECAWWFWRHMAEHAIPIAPMQMPLITTIDHYFKGDGASLHPTSGWNSLDGKPEVVQIFKFINKLFLILYKYIKTYKT